MASGVRTQVSKPKWATQCLEHGPMFLPSFIQETFTKFVLCANSMWAREPPEGQDPAPALRECPVWWRR